MKTRLAFAAILLLLPSFACDDSLGGSGATGGVAGGGTGGTATGGTGGGASGTGTGGTGGTGTGGTGGRATGGTGGARSYPFTFVCESNSGPQCPPGEECPVVPEGSETCGDLPGLLGQLPI